VIRASGKLQLMLQLKYDDVILLSTKLVLSRLNPRHTLCKILTLLFMFLIIFAQKIFKVVYARTAGLNEVSRCDKCTVYMTANYDGDLMILSR
jgi:hypothetical protein